MAKMKRSALKQIVKECLVEILAEGLSESSEALTETIHKSAESRRGMGLGHRDQHVVENMNRKRRTAALDTPIVPNESFEENVQNAVETLSADPLMQEILSDTARGSLQRTSQVDQALGSTQLSEGSRGPNPTSGPQMAGDPAAIFEQIAPGSSSKWADLAFAGPVRPGAD